MNNVDAYIWKGRTYYRKGEYNRAIQEFRKAIRLRPDNMRTYIWRGWAYFYNEKYALSFQDFVKAIKLDSDIKSYDALAYITSHLNTISNLPKSFKIKSFEHCSKIWEITTELKEYLSEPNTTITHYTSLDALESLLSGKRFRLYNAAYMNDPNEGETFFTILKERGKKNSIDVKKTFYDNPIDFYSPAYIGSFTQPKDTKSKEQDELFLWRTYGKHKNQEAGGACMVFDKPYFFSSNVPSKLRAVKTQRNPSEEEIIDRLYLYKVVYKKSIGDNKKLRNLIQKLAIQLETTDNECLKKKPNDEKNKLIRRLVRELLDAIRFLFKSDHYSEENEMRIVSLVYTFVDSGPPNSRIKEDTAHCPPRLYLEVPERFRFDKILLGPQASGLDQWKQWAQLKPQGRSITIEKSKIPYGSS